MVKDNFWWITLCCLLVIASTAGWSVPLRVAVCANAVALLMDQTYHSLMLGCVAGDDTIIVVTRNEEDARLLASNIQIDGK